jgi:hypothetical protein
VPSSPAPTPGTTSRTSATPSTTGSRPSWTCPTASPATTTYRRLFERLDPDEFRRGFLGRIEALHEATGRQVIAIDGKTPRRSVDRAKGKSALHMVHT